MKTKSFTLVILAIFGMVILPITLLKNTKETDAFLPLHARRKKN